MALSLAMCASFAFAQAPVKKIDRDLLPSRQIAVSDVKPQDVDFKASIFTKDADIDTLFEYDFANMPSTAYGTSCKLSAADRIEDTLIGTKEHTITSAATFWHYYTDSANFASHASNDYPQLAQSLQSYLINGISLLMGPSRIGNDNGFMVLMMQEYTTADGNYNTYFALPAFNNTDIQHGVLEVRFNQFYRKFYDQCFIDYKVGNSWRTREINVINIDVAVNQYLNGRVAYTMPIAVAELSTIELRFRVYTTRYAERPGYPIRDAFGYAWAVDNVQVLRRKEVDRMRITDAGTIDGFYGTLPEGMSIPITYGMTVGNLTRNTISNVNVEVSAGTNRNEAFTSVATSTPVAIPGGDVDTTYTIAINERGFYFPDEGLWSEPYMSTDYGTANITGNYLKRGLPTSNTGTNYYAVTLNAGTRQLAYDTVLYNVSEYNSSLGGYIWGRDNGVISAGSIFAPQFTDDGYIPNDWAGANNHHNSYRYWMHVRYTTGSTIPNEWVLRGMEIVPSPLIPESDLNGIRIVPYMFEEFDTTYADGRRFFNWDYVQTGIEGLIYTLDSSGYNDLSTGYILPGDSYNSIRFMFPEQPALKPNTSYRVGYILAQNGNFAPAGTESRYADGDSSYMYYRNDAVLSDYASQVDAANPYEVLVYDPQAPNAEGEAPGRLLYSHYSFQGYPLIRPIVGAHEMTGSTTVNLECDEHAEFRIGDTNVANATDVITNDQTFSIAEGAYRSIYVMPKGDHTVIRSITLNGNELIGTEGDEDLAVEFLNYTYNVEDANASVLLYRDYYLIFVGPALANTTLNIVVTTEQQEHIVGIDPVSANVRLALTPNPATSTVKLDLAGVSGMVNCNIIDMSGRVVYNATMDAEKENPIDVSSMPAGAYFVRVTNNNFSKIEKLIIK